VGRFAQPSDKQSQYSAGEQQCLNPDRPSRLGNQTEHGHSQDRYEHRQGLQRTSREICSGDDAVKIYGDRNEQQPDERTCDPADHDEEVVPWLQVVR
jgi:hypothetical protein